MDEAKRELTQLWLRKARHDLMAAKTLAEGKSRILDVAVYHCQQAAEKAVKGFLVSQDIRFEKTHDIKILVNLALPAAPAIGQLLDKADRLTDYATEFRYPGEILEPDEDEFRQALDDAEAICQAVLALLSEDLASS